MATPQERDRATRTLRRQIDALKAQLEYQRQRADAEARAAARAREAADHAWRCVALPSKRLDT